MPDLLFKNWPLKLLAVGLAFGIWVSVTGQMTIVQDFHPPLDIRLNDDRILASDVPTTVTVRLRGSETAIRKLDALRLGVGIDLRDGLIGDRDVSLDESNLSGLPRGVQLEFLSPDRIRLAVDRRIRKQLPVEPTFLGKPPEGYAFYGADARPAELLVEGPEAEVQALEVLRTNPIRLDELTSPTTRRINTVPDSPHVRVVNAEGLQVRVVVDATPVERLFDKVQVVLSGESWDTEVSPTEISVTLAGPPGVLDQVRPDLLQARAKVDGLEPRTQAYNVDLEIRYNDTSLDERERLSVRSLSRSRVRVRITDRSSGP